MTSAAVPEPTAERGAPLPSAAAPRAAKPGAEARAKRRTSIRQDAVNLPNMLTMLRIVLIPVVLWLIADGTPAGNFWALVAYAVTAITDVIDGWLARRMGLISVLGKFLDPLADKLLVMASLVALISRPPAGASASPGSRRARRG